jgi:archaetidylinositol phosphate synthase
VSAGPQRVNQGWLAPLERPALAWLAPRMPGWITPDRLTLIGLAGAVTAMVGYALSAKAPAWLFLASAGLALNWFGDSLDGTLARHRGIERPRYGYVLDNGIDMVEQLIFTLGVGLSGFIRWELCFLALASLLMMSSLSFIRAAAGGPTRLTYGGLGLTEVRVMFVMLNVTLFLAPPDRIGDLGLPMAYPDLMSLVWSLSTLAMFAWSFIAQLRELAADEPPRP